MGRTWLKSMNLTLAPCCRCNKCDVNHKNGEAFHVYCEHHATEVVQGEEKKKLCELLAQTSIVSGIGEAGLSANEKGKILSHIALSFFEEVVDSIDQEVTTPDRAALKTELIQALRARV